MLFFLLYLKSRVIESELKCSNPTQSTLLEVILHFGELTIEEIDTMNQGSRSTILEGLLGRERKKERNLS
jgi:hypothetical protein